MKRKISAVFPLLACVLLGALGAGCATTPKESSKTYVVVAKPGALMNAIAEYSKESMQTLQTSDVLHNLDAFFVTMTPSQAAELAKNTELVTAIGPADTIFTIPETDLLDPANVELGSFYLDESAIKTPPGIFRLGAPQAWADGVDGSGATVCVVDTGVDYTHPALEKKFVEGKDFTGTAGNVNGKDDHGHGTHCAGTIAGEIVGMAPGAKIYSAKVLSKGGSGSSRGVMAGVDWCVGKGVQVVSMSLGGGPSDPAFAELVKRAREKGTQIIAASGNNGQRNISYPAAYPGANAIGALGTYEKDLPFDADERASFSNYGPQLSVVAPGVRVLSTVLNGKYDEYSGTSMATPHIAGLVALMQSASLKKNHKPLTPAEVDEALRFSSWGRNLGPTEVRNDEYGYGVPNITSLIFRLNRLQTKNQ